MVRRGLNNSQPDLMKRFWRRESKQGNGGSHRKQLTKNVSLISMIAWRKLWKNKRRTALTLLTIMVGTGMIIFMRAIQDGGFAKMAEDIISLNSGHIQIHDNGFWDDQSIDRAFILPDFFRDDFEVFSFGMTKKAFFPAAMVHDSSRCHDGHARPYINTGGSYV